MPDGTREPVVIERFHTDQMDNIRVKRDGYAATVLSTSGQREIPANHSSCHGKLYTSCDLKVEIQ